MDAYELAEDLLDAIAAERAKAVGRQQEALSKMDSHREKGEDDEAGRYSTEAERHSTAALAISMALARCQRIVDEAVAEIAANQ